MSKVNQGCKCHVVLSAILVVYIVGITIIHQVSIYIMRLHYSHSRTSTSYFLSFNLNIYIQQ